VKTTRTFYEFFAGGGMARSGLGPRWECLFANDNDEKKAAAYRCNFGATELLVEDVGRLNASLVKGAADLAWASFPCQDLSLAGNGAGLRGERSGTFWSFWRLIQNLRKEGRAPRLVVLENVCGALTSHNGRDFAAIGDALAGAGYRFGALVIDSVKFVPQSRPRLFVIGASTSLAIPPDLSGAASDEKWTSPALSMAQTRLSRDSAKNWVWWTLPAPHQPKRLLSDLLEENPTGVAWHAPEDTRRLIDLMSELNRAKVSEKKRESKLTRRKVVGTIYKRTRPDDAGKKRQRAEVRFDEIAGCLRTPAGGSSRQTILVIEGDTVRSRLLSSREAARLMGLRDDYQLPQRYNEAYHLAGDGLVVPVVRYLAEFLLEPLLDANDPSIGLVPELPSKSGSFAVNGNLLA